MHFGRAINMRALFRSVMCLQAQACPALRETEVRRIRFCIQHVGKSRLTRANDRARRDFLELIKSRSLSASRSYEVTHAKRTPINMSHI